MELRQAWQLPATHALLPLLSPTHSVPTPTPSALEDALNRADSPLLAQIHARLLRLPPSSQHKWRASITRYVHNHPQYFNDDVPQPPPDEDAYAGTTPHERLLLLHALAEAVLSEHPPDATVDTLRPYPIGVDAVRNQYWYFGDAQRVYREPGQAVREKAEEKATATEKLQKAAQKAAQKESRRREREEKREAIGKRREERRKKEAEKWAPRVAAGRSTRASRRIQQQQAHKSKEEEEEEEEEEKLEEKEEKEEEVMDDWLLREIGIATDNEDEDEADKEKGIHDPKPEEAPRRSGRRRKPPQPPASPPAKRPRKKDASPPPPPPPRRKEFADPELRACTHWETVTTNADELRAFIERFGPREKLAPVERSLLKRLDEILPEMDEAEARVRREADRKAKTQFLLMNQKRSTRVQAITARREEEARREAELEEREREAAARVASHERAVLDAVAFLVREQSRDIRGARREFGMDEAIDRDEEAIRTQEREKALRTALAAPVRRSARTQRPKRQFIDEAEPKDGVHTGAEAEVEASVPEAVPETVIEADAEAQADTVLHVADKEVPDASRPCDGEETDRRIEDHSKAASVSGEAEPSRQAEEKSKRVDPEDRGTTIDSMEDTAKSSPEAERLAEQDQNRRTFSSACREEDIGAAFTWSTNDEDKLPMRVLDKFFFASNSNFADVPLEKCEVPESEMVGFGIVIPPATARPDVERVEISRVIEWMFEYGGSPKIWIKTEHSWYELREPAVEYQKVFLSARRKFEICARVSIMGDTMRGAQLNYGSILDYLSYPYGAMLAYQDSDVLTEKRYIVSQIELLNKRSLLQSGFIRELQKQIRAEDRKAAAQERAKHEDDDAALERKREAEFASMGTADTVIVTAPKVERDGEKQQSGKVKATQMGDAKKSGDQKKVVSKRSPRRRSGKAVPRAVSSIVNGLLRAATKSYKTPRKRKAKTENGASKGGPSKKSAKVMVSSPKRMVSGGTGDSDKHGKKNGTVDARVANGFHTLQNGDMAMGVGTGKQAVSAKEELVVEETSFQRGSPKAKAKAEAVIRPLIVVPKMVGNGMSPFVGPRQHAVMGPGNGYRLSEANGNVNKKE